MRKGPAGKQGMGGDDRTDERSRGYERTVEMRGQDGEGAR